jgi:DNA polymerase I-like protein with 3'-5' exonuclease and polymerase domains
VWEPSPEDVTFASYNATDVYRTAGLVKVLPPLMQSTGHWPFYSREFATQVPAVLAMQRRGIPFNQDRKGLYRRALRRELGEIDATLATHYLATARLIEAKGACLTKLLAWALPGVWAKGAQRRSHAPYTKGEWDKLVRRLTFNPNSRDQLREWLFEDLGLRHSTHTDGGSPSTDQDALQRILQRLRKMDEPWRPILYDLMHRSRLQKIDQDYLDPTVVDGRVYPSIKMAGTESLRFAYSDPAVHSWPDEVRQFIEAPLGSMLVGADYSAVESRIFALLTKDPVDLEIFEKNRLDPANPMWDIHIRTACDLFGWSLEEFMRMPDGMRKGARNAAKVFRYSVIQYGGQPETAKSKVFCPCHRCAHKVPPTIELTPQEKAQQARRWFQKHPSVLAWRRGISNRIRQTGRSETVMGQVRYYATPWDSRTSPCAVEREAWNGEIQPVATTIIRRAMRKLHTMGVGIFLEHHDALYAEAPETTAREVALTMKRVMEEPVPEFGGAVFPVEVHVGRHLGVMETVHSVE